MAEPTQERLDELGEQIEEVRRDAEEHGLLPDSTPEPSYEDPDPDDAEDVPPESPARGVVDDDNDAEDAPEPSEPA